MELYVMAAVIVYLGLKIFALRITLGGLLGYITTRENAMPSIEELDAWRIWYLRKSFGLRADLPDKFL